MRYIRTVIAILFFLLCFSMPFTYAATEQRTALVIGNSAYSSSPLKNPVNDAADMAATLTKLGFFVTLKKDANHQQMEEAIRDFGDQLKKGGVGLFFYAGHGVQIGGKNYLLPVGAKINKELDVKFQAVDAEIVLGEMGNAGNNLNIVILDACRDNPYGRSFRSASRGLAIISDAPRGTFITYSTSPGKVAADGSGRNSPYTESLIRHMNSPGLPIEEVFKEVRKDMGRKTGGQQVPWELSSLEGKFFFHPGAVAQSTTSTPLIDYEAEKRKIAEEKERLRQETEVEDQRNALEMRKMEKEKENIARKKALAEEKKRLDEARVRLEAEQEAASEKAPPEPKKPKQAKTARTKTVAMAKVPQKECIENDGRFCKFDNGTVLDTRTNLMWAERDNGSDVNWIDAKSYCDSYRGGGYSDWRMPTQDELAGLYDLSKSYQATQRNYYVYLTELIQLSTCCPWASEMRGSDAAFFRFYDGGRGRGNQSRSDNLRVIPVRSGK